MCASGCAQQELSWFPCTFMWPLPGVESTKCHLQGSRAPNALPWLCCGRKDVSFGLWCWTVESGDWETWIMWSENLLLLFNHLPFSGRLCMLISYLNVKEWAALRDFCFGVFCPKKPTCLSGSSYSLNPSMELLQTWAVTSLGARQCCLGGGIPDMCSAEAFRESFCSPHYLWEEKLFISRAVSSALFSSVNYDKHVGGKPLNRSN